MYSLTSPENTRSSIPAASSQPRMLSCHLGTTIKPPSGCMVIVICGPGSCLVSKKPWLSCQTNVSGLWPKTQNNLLTSKPTALAKLERWMSALLLKSYFVGGLLLSYWKNFNNTLLQQINTNSLFLGISPLKTEHSSLFSTSKKPYYYFVKDKPSMC